METYRIVIEYTAGEMSDDLKDAVWEAAVYANVDVNLVSMQHVDSTGEAA